MRTKYFAVVLVLVSLILTQAIVNALYSITPITPNTSSVAVSPGKSDLLLGNDFPPLNSVKLSYPDSAILTNSVGDLLFSVRLNPLMLNTTSAQVNTPGYVPSPSQVVVWGSGFSLADTSCTITGLPVSLPLATPCTILPDPTYGPKVVTAGFNIADVPAGTYTITATGYPTNDFSSAPFTVLPPSLALDPSSGPAGTKVKAFGIGYYSTDTSCALYLGQTVLGTCSFSSSGVLTTPTTFTIPSTLSPGTYFVSVETNGGDSNEASATFTVTQPKQTTAQITLSPAIASVGTMIIVTGSGFSLSDAGTYPCLSGSPVSNPSSVSCTFTTGILSASFTVANVPPGVYTVTATGSTGDFATAGLIVYSTLSVEIPNSTTIGISIYVPPEFTGLTIGNLWTSFTNNYNPNSIRLSKQSSADEIAPNWWQINVQNLIVTHNPSSPPPAPLVSQRVFPPFLANQTQFIRLFQVTSPSIAGRYFFKAFMNYQNGAVSIGAENFPTLVVKASRDPATISGTLRDLGDRNPSRAGKPIRLVPGLGAQIIATGYNAYGQAVSAQTFINSTAHGSYTLLGVAPGTYNITVYAAGYVPTTINQLPYPYPFNPSITLPTPITVASAQSLEGVDIYLSDSPNVTGTVLSQTASGTPIPWGSLVGLNGLPTNRSITVELISIVDGRTVVATNQQPYTLPTAYLCNLAMGSLTSDSNCATNPSATDYQFTIQYEQSSWSGEIPENYANFTSGLPTGEDYFVRAFVTSYIQLAEIRAHIANYTLDTELPVPLIRTGFISVTVHFHNFDFPASDLEDDPITVPRATLTVSAYNMQGVLSAQNSTSVLQGAENAQIELFGFSNSRQQGIFSQFSQNYGLLPGTYYIEARLTAAPVVIGNAATTTNAPIAGTQVVGDLYYQIADCVATMGLGLGDIQVSCHLYRAGGVELHIYSIDTEVPPIYRDWAFPGQPIFLTFVPVTETSIYETNTTQLAGSYEIPGAPPGQTTNAGLSVIGFPVLPGQPGVFACFVYTLGYTQQTPCQFTIQLGFTADISVWMIVNPLITLTVAFRHEGLLTAINSTDPYAQPINNLTATPVRLEAFDSMGNFVAANETYIPNGARVANFTLAGFSNYYGDPRYVWAGFYDTTDQVSQQSGGLLIYPWELAQPYHEFTVRIWVDGYYQQYPVSVTVPTNLGEVTRGNVSITIMLDRASRISGIVAGPDFFNIARPQSWAVVDLEPNNYTLSGIIDVEPGNYSTTSLDGFFQVWVPEGTYGMGVLLGGYASYQAELAVPAGSDFSMWIWLENYQLSTQTGSGIIGVPVAAVMDRLPAYAEV